MLIERTILILQETHSSETKYVQSSLRQMLSGISKKAYDLWYSIS